MIEAAVAVAEAIRRGNDFVLTFHENPDGDSIGSTLAMARALRLLGKQATVATPSPYPKVFRYLCGEDDVVPWEEVKGSPSVALIIDCGDLNRFGMVGKAVVEKARTVINVDHHVTNSQFGHINYVDSAAAAAGEQVIAILDELGVEIDTEMATCLLTAIMTDTGSFRYPNTTPGTLKLASRLVGAGARTSAVAEYVYDTRSLSSIRLLQVALSRLKLSAGGRVAWSIIYAGDFRETGATEAEAEGIVNYPRSIEGVEAGVLFRETPDGKTKVAFRSRREIDVSQVALIFGGGGHPRASGCTYDGTLDEAVEKVLEKVFAAAGDHR